MRTPQSCSCIIILTFSENYFRSASQGGRSERVRCRHASRSSLSVSASASHFLPFTAIQPGCYRTVRDCRRMLTMSSEIRQRHPKVRHSDSDSAVAEAERHSRRESEISDLKEELTEKVETWRERVHKVRICCNNVLYVQMNCLCRSTAAFTRRDDSYSRWASSVSIWIFTSSVALKILHDLSFSRNPAWLHYHPADRLDRLSDAPCVTARRIRTRLQPSANPSIRLVLSRERMEKAQEQHSRAMEVEHQRAGVYSRGGYS